MSDVSKQIELHETTATVDADDRRPRIDQPPPVRLVAIDDCYLLAPAGLERQLDEFYEGIMNLQRLETEPGEGPYELVYRAENFNLRIGIVERPVAREDYRRVLLAVSSLNDHAARLVEAEIEYVREKGLTPGHDYLHLNDPAGNPVAIGEYRISI